MANKGLWFSLLAVLAMAAAPPKESVVAGRVALVSKLPDPAKSDYKDCYFTAEFAVDSAVSGPPTAARVIVVFPGFHDRKLTAAAQFKQGDCLRLNLIPFDALPQDKQEVQQADD